MTDGDVQPPFDTDKNGFEIHVRTDKEIEEINKRALNLSEKKDYVKPWIIPPKRELDLLFFRMIFQHMLVESGASDEDKTKSKAPDEESTQALDEDKTKSKAPDDEGGIPVAAFQRTLERMFYVLRDSRGFDAKNYDLDDNGKVGWSEFVHVFRQRQIVIKLSLCERIFITLSDPESSWLAQAMSTFVLIVIATSSVCFMLGTTFNFQQEPVGADPPKPLGVFKAIEDVCLFIFVVEYLARLATCWSVREEVIDQKQLKALTIGYEAINLKSPPRRIVEFVFDPTNLIDLAAILPGVLSLFVRLDAGGGFVVLRLIRLTRVFRAPAIREPALVIAITIKRSTKALGILVFNLGLGIVIFGSLMYLFEGGTWDPERRTYMRELYGVRVWNQNTSSYTTEKEESPFISIPHSFWWAIVTATTVGYGDVYPTTPIGFLIATLNMLFSLVMTALPVGVIGGTFATVWEEVHANRKEQLEYRKQQDSTILASCQRFEPFETMSKLMMIDVWNERFLKQDHLKFDQSVYLKRPLKGEFMGQIKVKLELSDKPVSEVLSLKLNSDYETVQREVTGTINLKYEWTPDPNKMPRGEEDRKMDCLCGTLTVTILSGDRLLNMNLQDPSKPTSTPYCQVLCYPRPPSVERGLVQPCIWRTPSKENSCSPEWNCTHSFHFDWKGSRVRPSMPDWNVHKTSHSQSTLTRPMA